MTMPPPAPSIYRYQQGRDQSCPLRRPSSCCWDRDGSAGRAPVKKNTRRAVTTRADRCKGFIFTTRLRGCPLDRWERAPNQAPRSTVGPRWHLHAHHRPAFPLLCSAGAQDFTFHLSHALPTKTQRGHVLTLSWGYSSSPRRLWNEGMKADGSTSSGGFREPPWLSLH
jgi:hypothetical protein